MSSAASEPLRRFPGAARSHHSSAAQPCPQGADRRKHHRRSDHCGPRVHGWLQPFELLIYDGLRVVWAGQEPSNRILLVGGTEDDVTDFDWPLRDGELADLLERIASWNPRVIGVDIYRDKPKPPGTERLAEVLARHKEIVWIFKLQEGARRAILPPEVLRGTERAVLADFIPDPGNVVRRALLVRRRRRITPRWGWSWRCGILLPIISGLLRAPGMSCVWARR